MTDSPATARLLVMTALAYAVLGAIGLMAAIPPGYASPVFPAAGLALACVLWFGNRALGGIWLGSALLNLAHAGLSGHLNRTTALVALIIATGAAAQAWTGAWLVKRRREDAWRVMEREQDAFGLLFLGGVLACIVSAAVSVSGLGMAGVIESAQLPFTWWNWYVGDTLGVFVFAPLTLCFLNQKDDIWRERRRRIVIPLLLTLGVTALIFYGASRWEKLSQDQQLGDDGEAIAKRIADRLITHREVLSSLGHFIEATPDFTFPQFEQFTRITLRDNPDIFALSFNDLVVHGQRPAFERMMTSQSPLGAYRIMERDKEKRLIRANPRPEYVAVRYIVPLAKNQPAVGFDIYSEPVRRDAIDRGRKSLSMAVTAPVKLVQEQRQRIGVLELLPIQGAPATDGAEARLRGFAVAVVKVDELVDIATRGAVPPGLVFRLSDRLASGKQGLLYNSDPDVSFTPSDRSGTWSTELLMGDRVWDLSVYTTERYREQHRPWLAWGVGATGLLFTALLQILLLGMTGRTAVFQRQNEELKKKQAEIILKDQALLQSEKMASIGQLAAGVAHEINNPMAFITGNLRILGQYFDQLLQFDRLRQEQDDRELSPETRELMAANRDALEVDYIQEDGLSVIQESLRGADRVTKIVRDLKNFSRVDAQEFEAATLIDCLESSLTIVRNELKYVATVRKEYEANPQLLCHPGQLNQVFTNLLVNAGQAITPPGEIVLKCWEEDDFAYASVSDTGHGIAEDNLSRIFDPFFTTKEVGKGTGLGLSISYEIIKKHGGDLLVESAVGIGTTFTVKLPRTPEESS